MNKRHALKNIVSLSTWAVLGGLTACTEKKAVFHAIDLTGADYAKNFELLDTEGQTRTLTDFKNQIVVVFFGYVQCPDFCPTTLADLTEVKRLLGTQGDRLRVVFVTVDLVRDTPELLKNYMTNFDPSFLALRPPSPQALDVMVKDFKAYYKINPGPTPTSYTVEHSANSYIYDPQGRLRLLSRYGTAPKEIAEDVRQLLQGV